MPNSLEIFTEAARSAWGPLTSKLIADCKGYLQDLLETAGSEDWLKSLVLKAPASEELYRDPTHGFVLLAHTENAGLYRPPHDHGRGWVIYAMQQGEIEMGTYARTVDPDGHIRLVKRNSTLVSAGQVQVYLPGDIHDTLCVSSTALLFRFTERDLRLEDQQAHQVTRYIERDGVWTTGAT
jgi:predicted metal-dependent enzyme (double-stranded beta helix superfamily)